MCEGTPQQQAAIWYRYNIHWLYFTIMFRGCEMKTPKDVCKQCGGKMVEGFYAMQGVSGRGDFHDSDAPVTMSTDFRSCRRAKCEKCEDCGWSVL